MDVELLNEAFLNFTKASKSLEAYYGGLQEKVRHLTTELEKKNRELNEALADAEKNKDYLNAILYNLEEAIIVINPDNRVTMVNKSAEELLGVTLADIGGRVFEDLDFSIREDGSDTYLFAGGKKYSIILSHSPVVDSEGFLRGNVILIKDVTRLRELEVHHERNQRLIAMGEMAAKIVHEVRNPLCSIELFSSMLEKELKDNGHKELARGISTGIGNLNNILTNMLFFARPHKPAMRRIRLNRVVEDSTELFIPLMESRKVRIEKSVFDCEISGDGELLKQVVMNIVINAIQAMHDSGNMAVTMRREKGFVIVEVADTGEGIGKENMEKIFDPFFSTKDAGTGLGLAIASKIMQTHNGYIKVKSEEGEGSTFSLWFPDDPAPSGSGDKGVS
ncbi:MAG TPA: ATP-binding protein [Thermodesulfovibrionales bacterium]|jgi:PAS domain S-box-containing protein|nr:ATP-binding protein [Thermodesulfovibrionales bacterium]